LLRQDLPARRAVRANTAHYKDHMIFVVVALSWCAVALTVALLLGRAIRTADRRAPFTDHLAGLPAELTVDDVLGERAPEPSV
jgi:hypothetical protein